MELTEEQKKKYSARVWAIQSPEKRYTGIVIWDKARNLSKMEYYFRDYSIKPLFSGERKTAENKANRGQK